MATVVDISERMAAEEEARRPPRTNQPLQPSEPARRNDGRTRTRAKPTALPPLSATRMQECDSSIPQKPDPQMLREILADVEADGHTQMKYS